MATKSILKNIDIKDRRMGRAIISALENAEGKKSKQVIMSRTFKEIKGDKIKSLFGDK